MTRLAELRYKEVVNICDGQCMGCVYDAEIDMLTGRICSLIIPGPRKFFGLFGRGDDYIVPWGAVRRIGDEVILVECPSPARCPRRKRGEEC